MSFSAARINANGEKEIVSVFGADEHTPRALGKFVCPECGRVMFLRRPYSRAMHFYHAPRGGEEGEEKCPLAWKETPEHIAAKEMIATKLIDNERYKKQISAIHVDTKWIGNRRADVAFDLVGGGIEVHEVQLASITIEELEQRTKDYLTNGATEVHWWFGKAARTTDNLNWSDSAMGEVLTLDFSTSSNRISI